MNTITMADAEIAAVFELFTRLNLNDRVVSFHDDDVKPVEEEEDQGDPFIVSDDATTRSANWSVHVTPDKRDGMTFETAKNWLKGWLVLCKIDHCHVTRVAFAAPGLVQFAHMLLPRRLGAYEPIVRSVFLSLRYSNHPNCSLLKLSICLACLIVR